MGLQFSITAIGSNVTKCEQCAGTACVAAFTAAMRIKMFVMCPLDSLGNGYGDVFRTELRVGKPDRIWMVSSRPR